MRSGSSTPSRPGAPPGRSTASTRASASFRPSSSVLRPTTSGSPRRSSSRARSDGCPPRTVIYGIEGGRFEVGDELTLAVAVAAERVADGRARGGGRVHEKAVMDDLMRDDRVAGTRRGRGARRRGSAFGSARSRTSRPRTSASTSRTPHAARSPRAPRSIAELRTDPTEPEAQGVVLESIDVEL